MAAKREKGLPANYGVATPEEIALAVLRHRPKEKKPWPKQRREKHPDNPPAAR